MKHLVFSVFTVLFSISAYAQETYKIGDFYNENGRKGVVFWVDQTGEHGKIISMTESKKKLKWASDKEEMRRLIGANNAADGAKNMEIVQAIPEWETKYPAFAWCAALGEGWYLPAIEELEALFLKSYILDQVNHTLEEKGGVSLSHYMRYWWSSTECISMNGNLKFAWNILMLEGDQETNHSYKYQSHFVRAIAKF